MRKNKNNILAISIREARKKKGISQKEFALLTGLGLRFVREIEQGKMTVRLDKALMALNSLGLDISVVNLERIR